MNARRNVFEHRAGNRTVICKHQQAVSRVTECLVKAIYNLVRKQALARLFTLAYRRSTLSFYRTVN